MYSLYYNHTIYENGTRVTTSECFYDDSIPSPDYRVISPTLNKEVGKAGSLSFILPPTNIEYSNIDREKSEIVCYKFDKEIWRGRILSDNVDFYKQRKITCEGELTYLNDTCAGTKYWKNSSQGAPITYFTFLGQLLDVHNQKNTVPGTNLFAGPYDKRIYRGLWPKIQDDGRASFETKNETVLELVNNIAKEVDMYPKITWDDRGQGLKRYLDFVKGSPAGQPNRLGETTTPIIDNETNDPTVVINSNTIVCVTNDLVEYGGTDHIYNGNVWTAYYGTEGRYFENTIEQEIVFGENLLDFTRSYDPTQIVTAVVLRGSKKDTQDNTDAYVDLTGVGGWTDNGIVHPANADYIYSANAFQTYGYKEAHLELETTGTEQEQIVQLKRIGMNYLRVMQFSTLKLEVSAVDLNHLGVNTDDFDIYYDVKVISDPHGLDKWFPIMSMSIPLDAIENSTYSLGTTEDITLTGAGQRANEEFYNMIKALPTEESVLNAAKSQAYDLIEGATTGYISITHADGKSQALIISKEDSGPESTHGFWKWTSGGLGYYPNGKNTRPEDILIGITDNGAIVADRITTGSLNADRINGGILYLNRGTLTNFVIMREYAYEGYLTKPNENIPTMAMTMRPSITDSNGRNVAVFRSEVVALEGRAIWVDDITNPTQEYDQDMKMNVKKIAASGHAVCTLGSDGTDSNFGNLYNYNFPLSGGSLNKCWRTVNGLHTFIFGRGMLLRDFEEEDPDTNQPYTPKTGWVTIGNEHLYFVNGVLTNKVYQEPEEE